MGRFHQSIPKPAAEDIVDAMVSANVIHVITWKLLNSGEYILWDTGYSARDDTVDRKKFELEK